MRIGTPEELDVTFGLELAQVSGAVDAAKFRMVDECLACLFGIVVVALGESHAANVEVSLDFWRTELQIGVEHVEGLVLHRVAVRYAVPIRSHFAERVDDGPDGRFGSAAETDEICLAACVLRCCANVKRDAVARKEDLAERKIP